METTFITVESADIRLLNLETRLPFEFGTAKIKKLPHCIVQLRCRFGDKGVMGRAADHLPPKWFVKNSEEPVVEEMKTLARVVEHACNRAEGLSGRDVFTCWSKVYDEQKRWGEQKGHPPLLWAFGATFVERALIDAFCRATETTFPEALRSGKLGLQLGAFYAELSGNEPAEFLPSTSRTSIRIRHTVGYGDPLWETGNQNVDDGLPVTLEENIRTYGLERFKIKVAGNARQDAERVTEVIELLQRRCEQYKITIDANEQYASVNQLRSFLKRLQQDSGRWSMKQRLMFVEQPFPREKAFDEQVTRALQDWSGPSLVIDESDARLDSCARALQSGYTGTSHKNCKGVFKGVANACLLSRRRIKNPDEDYILSAEDLTTIGPISLHQDLAVVATLDLPEAERNGHHYFRGLSAFSKEVQASALKHHSGLFQKHDHGYPTLQINKGLVDLESVVSAPYGYSSEIDELTATPLQEWSPPP